MILIVIGILSLLSYATGIKAVLDGKYKPNLYSRIIWFLLAANALYGLVLLESEAGVILLAAMQTLGSLLFLLATLRHSVLVFGKVEWISSVLLALSGVLWLFGDYPAVNVGISLIAHFIGGVPTIATVIRRPASEKTMFWGYFAIASAIALVASDKSSFEQYMFPLYFAIYNTIMVILSQRHHLKLPRLASH